MSNSPPNVSLSRCDTNHEFVSDAAAGNCDDSTKPASDGHVATLQAEVNRVLQEIADGRFSKGH